MKKTFQNYHEVLLRFMSEESSTSVILLDFDLKFLEYNSAFSKTLQISSADETCFNNLLTDACQSEFTRYLKNNLYEEVFLYFKARSDVHPIMKTRIYPVTEGYLLIGESHGLSETETMRRITKLNNHLSNTIRELHRKNMDLEKAQAIIKTLKGLLPICSYCKKIRDDEGYWNTLEEYISTRSEAEFTHSICKECFTKEYSEYSNKLGDDYSAAK